MDIATLVKEEGRDLWSPLLIIGDDTPSVGG